MLRWVVQQLMWPTPNAQMRLSRRRFWKRNLWSFKCALIVPILILRIYIVVQTLLDEGFRAIEVCAGDSISVALGEGGALRVWGSFRVSPLFALLSCLDYVSSNKLLTLPFLSPLMAS